MSLRIKRYQLVGRDWLEKKLKHLDQCFMSGCKYCGQLGCIKTELERNGFYTLNRAIGWWRIEEGRWSMTVIPVNE